MSSRTVKYTESILNRVLIIKKPPFKNTIKKKKITIKLKKSLGLRPVIITHNIRAFFDTVVSDYDYKICQITIWIQLFV